MEEEKMNDEGIADVLKKADALEKTEDDSAIQVQLDDTIGGQPLHNPKHEQFVHALAMGEIPRRAYMQAFAGCPGKNASNSANKLMKMQAIRDRLSFLQRDTQTMSKWTRESFVKKLTDVIHTASRESDVVRAMELLDKVLGFSVRGDTNIGITNIVFASPDGSGSVPSRNSLPPEDSSSAETTEQKG